MDISRITLGTAQLGLNYGINNKRNKLNIEEALDVLNYAYLKGINSFDTAQSYGKSEELLGKWIKNYRPKNVFITTKITIPSNTIKIEDLDSYIYEGINSSLERLQINIIDNLLLHRFDDLEFFKDELIDPLLELKNRKLVKKIGVSLYDVSELERVIEYGIFDTVQIPASIFDQRFIKSGILEKAKKKNIIIFSRSIFLQGLILRNPNNIPMPLRGIKDYIVKLNDFANSKNLSILEIAINYLKEIEEIDSLIIGVDNVKQLQENIRIFNSKNYIDYSYLMKDLSGIPIKFLDPRKWKV